MQSVMVEGSGSCGVIVVVSEGGVGSGGLTYDDGGGAGLTYDGVLVSGPGVASVVAAGDAERSWEHPAIGTAKAARHAATATARRDR